MTSRQQKILIETEFKKKNLHTPHEEIQMRFYQLEKNQLVTFFCLIK
jgi:hypothetical protein